MIDSTDSRNLVQLPRSALSSILVRMGSGRTATEVATSLREAGVDAAEPIYELLRRRFDLRDPAEVSTESFWSELGGLFAELGWGTLSQDRPHPGVIALASRDWFESEGASASVPGCHFSTGLLAELFRGVAGSDLASMEVECRSSGGESCRFLVGSPAALEAIFEEMADGSTYQNAISALA